MMAYEVSALKDKEMKQKQKCIEEELRQGYNETKELKGYVFITQSDGNLKVLVYSTSHLTRAVDLLGYLQDKTCVFAAFQITGQMDSADNIASYCVAEGKAREEGDLAEQIKKALMHYDDETIVIDVGTFFEREKDQIIQWKQYKKVNLPRCYVSLSGLKEGLKLQDSDGILLKTLENESGIVLKSEDTIIMIGTKGEPYDMPKDKFNQLYEGELEINRESICSSYEMEPKAIVLKNDREINLMDYAAVCRSKKRNEVYACLVDKNIKVFSTRIAGTNQYYYGNGEKEPVYLTVDKETPTSVHIVNRDAFEKSYEVL
jgi:hypothetical protein